jgi:alcohol dehydrogenase class IV
VHGYAAVLGGMFETAPHGTICATLLPHVFRKNAEKLSSMAEGGDASARLKLSRFTEVSRIVTGLDTATVSQGVTWLEMLVRDLNVPTLSLICAVQPHQLPDIAQSTAGSSSTKGNPVLLTVAELEEILKKAF